MDVARARTVLGVTAGASAGEIDRAFRSAAGTYHPDRGGDDTSFRAAVEARSVLRRTLPAGRAARPEVRVIGRRSFGRRVLEEIDRRHRHRRHPRVERPQRGRRTVPLQ